MKQSFVLGIDRFVALAGDFPQRFEIGNFNETPAIPDDAGLLQFMRYNGNAVPLHTDHLSQKILRQVQFIFT